MIKKGVKLNFFGYSFLRKGVKFLRRGGQQKWGGGGRCFLWVGQKKFY